MSSFCVDLLSVGPLCISIYLQITTYTSETKTATIMNIMLTKDYKFCLYVWAVGERG